MTSILNAISPICDTCPVAFKLGCARPVYPKWHKKTLKYLFIGEAPGTEEEDKNEGFIGPSGQFLREQIEKANIDLDECLFTNACWCGPRPSNDLSQKIAKPTPEEALHCIPHAIQLIQRYRPQVILLVGTTAADALLKSRAATKITTKRGSWVNLKLTVRERYLAFRDWLNYNKESLPSEVPNEATGEAEQVNQLDAAVKELGYDESWTSTRVMPIVHPAFALRSGKDGRWGETILFDLQKARNYVEVDDTIQVSEGYRWINSVEEFRDYAEEMIRAFKSGEFVTDGVACDIETSEEANDAGKIGLLAYDPRVRILTVQFCYTPGEAVAVMLNHKESNLNDADSVLQFRQILKDIFDNVPLIGQNWLFDSHSIRCRLGLKKFTLAGDTMLMDHFLKAGLKLFSDLDSLGARYASTGLHKSRAKTWREQPENAGKSFEDMPLDLALEYAAGDVDVTLRVYVEIKKQLEAENRWADYRYIIHGSGFWDVINDMEWSGMPVDRAALDKLQEDYPARIDECFRKIQVNRYTFIQTEIARQVYNEKVREENKVIEAHNASRVPGTKKRPKKLKSEYDTWQAWMDNQKNWFNPNSNPQLQTLLTKILPIPWDHPDLRDIEYSDFDQKFAHRRKDKRTRGEKPRGNAHNRSILINVFRRWEKEGKERGDTGQEEVCGLVAEAVSLIDDYKLLSKMYGTYVKGIYPLIIDKVEPDEPWDPKDRCFPLYRPFADFPRPWSIHPSYHINGTDTGRLSSSDPNGQNYPGKGKIDPKANVKAPYISRWESKGGLIVQPDYSQIEIRVMVMLSGEEKLADAINRGEDIHRFVASMVHDCTPDEVTDEQRTPVKRVTFGIIYGQSVQALAMMLGISTEEAQHIQDKLFERCPKLKHFIDIQHEFVRDNGYVETTFGRRRYLPHMFSDDRQESSKALRDAVNTPIQSPASDLCAMAFGRSWRTVQELGIEAYPYSIIHDSQSFDVSPRRWFDVAELQYYEMVWRPYELWPELITVKTEADFEMGAGWGRMVSAKFFFDEHGEMDHNRVKFSGYGDYVKLVLGEISNGGQEYQEIYVGPHRDNKEAEKGKWEADIRVDRPDPICFCKNRKLEIVR